MNKLWILAFVFLSLLFSTQLGYSSSNDFDGTTLREAYTLGLKKAQEWNSTAMLSSLSSVDDTKSGNKGSNGKRRHWNMIFGIPDTNKQLLLTLHDKTFVHVVPVKGSNKKENLISHEDIAIDSPDALKKVKEHFILKPGKDWAVGYHYTLNKREGKTMMGVVGWNKDKLTKIYLDARTGQFLQ